MFRRIAIFAADRVLVRKFVISTPLVRRVALRFVAGTDLPAALLTVRALNAEGEKASLNFLGEHVRDENDAIAGADGAIEALDRIRDLGLDSHVSVKLTKIGLDVDETLCRTQLTRILDRASEVGNFVRIDMEESAYTDRTIEIFVEMLEQYGGATVGIVLQSYLRTHRQNLERLNALGARIRLVKGGYHEPADIAYQDRAEIDAAFREDTAVLLQGGKRPAIATHDPEAIAWARRLQQELCLEDEALEFQMLYGIRRDLQLALIREGYAVRCYVPYGGYFVSYVLGSLLRILGGPRHRRAHRDLREHELS